MFEDSTRYVDLKVTYTTLIAYLTGNDTQGNLFDVLHIDYAIIFVFLYGVIFLFGIHNVFVFIIETSYEKVRREMEHREANKTGNKYRDFFEDESEPKKAEQYLGVDRDMLLVRQQKKTFAQKYQEVKENVLGSIDITLDKEISNLLILVDYINDLLDQNNEMLQEVFNEDVSKLNF